MNIKSNCKVDLPKIWARISYVGPLFEIFKNAFFPLKRYRDITPLLTKIPPLSKVLNEVKFVKEIQNFS